MDAPGVIVCFVFMRWAVGRPDRIMAVACVFLLAYLFMCVIKRRFSSVRSWPLLVVTIAWVVFAAWESVVQGNIRADLFLICPVMAVISILGIAVSIGSLIACIFRK